MRLSPFSITVLVILVLALVLFSVQNARPLSSGQKTTVSSNPSSTNNQISRIKNLTYEYIYAPGSSTPEAVAQMISVSEIKTNATSSSVKYNSPFGIHILYNGYFGFDTGKYNSSAFLQKTKNLYYFGYRSTGAKNLLVYGSVANFTKYFILKNTSMTVPSGLSPANYLQETVYLSPTINASGKTWYFCGGIFVSYLNNTHSATAFNTLNFNGTDVYNSSILNYVSNDCTGVKVT